jgi:hypothetical protein
MASIASASSSNFLYDLFGVSTADANAAENKDHLDHVAAYADTAQGAWDVFRAAEYMIAWIQKLSPVSEMGPTLLGRVSEVVNTAGIGLSIPAIINDCNNLRKSVINFFVSQELPYSDPQRSRNITQAAKKSFLDSLSLTNNTAQAALFAERVKIVEFEPSHLSGIDIVFNASSAILDTAELVGEYFKLNFYSSPEAHPRNQAEVGKLEERKRLSWMIIAKDVASIGAASLALYGIMIGVAAQSIAAVAMAGLVFSSIWLTMKISSHLYNKIVVEAPINPFI